MITSNKALSFSCIILIIGLMSVDFLSPSLPYIQQDFLTSQEVIKNTVLIYMLVLGLFQLPYGFLSDRYGRKPVILVAFFISIFGIGLSVFANNVYVFYVARIITAIGSAGCPVIARAIIADISVNETQLKKSFSIFSLTSQLSPSIAPILGGSIQIISSWRTSLGLLMILNIICFGILFKFMPETRLLMKNNEHKLKMIQVFKSYFILLKHQKFVIISLLSALIYVYTIGFYNMLPFVLHKLNISVLYNGFINSFYACSLAIGAFVLHRYLYEIRSEMLFSRVILSLTVCFLFSTFLFYFLHIYNIYVWVIITIIWGGFIGFLCGVVAPLTLSMCMNGFAENKGIASSVQSSIKMFFTGIGLLLFSQFELVSLLQVSIIFLILTLIIITLWCFINNKE